MSQSRLWMVFDVESVGLHGEGFAVGLVVVDSSGRELEDERFACDPALAAGEAKGREWVAEYVPPIPFNCSTPGTVRTMFWAKWEKWRAQGALLAADVAWPVEARFLHDCMRTVPGVRDFDGPYPLVDISSVRLAAGFDPAASAPRAAGELPDHDPLADARHSARLLLEALKIVRPGVKG